MPSFAWFVVLDLIILRWHELQGLQFLYEARTVLWSLQILKPPLSHGTLKSRSYDDVLLARRRYATAFALQFRAYWKKLNKKCLDIFYFDDYYEFGEAI